MEDNDPEIDTAQTPSACLAFLEQIRKIMADSIPKNTGVNSLLTIDCSKNPQNRNNFITNLKLIFSRNGAPILEISHPDLRKVSYRRIPNI